MTIKLLANNGIRQTLTNNSHRDNIHSVPEHQKAHTSHSDSHKGDINSSSASSQACSHNNAQKINTHPALIHQSALTPVTDKKALSLSEKPVGYKPSPDKIILQWALALQQEVERPIDTDMLKNILQQREVLRQDKTLSRGDKASRTHALSKEFYKAQHVSNDEQNAVFKSALKHPFHKTVNHLQLSTREHEGKFALSETCQHLAHLPNSIDGEMIAGVAGGAFSGAATIIIGKAAESKRGLGTAAADMKRSGIFVPAKEYWDVPTRSIAIQKMKQSLAFIEKLETSGFDIPEQFKSLVADCHALYKNVNAKSYSGAAEKLSSIAVSALFVSASKALDAIAVSAPALAIVAIPLSKLCTIIGSLLGDGVGGIAKMDQIRTQNFLRADILDSGGEIDVSKAAQLYLQPQQIKEKYIHAALHRQIARAYHNLEKEEKNLSKARDLFSQNPSTQDTNNRSLINIEEQIQQTQHRIEVLKPRVNKSQHTDVNILINLKNSGIDAGLLKEAVALVSDSVIAEHTKWQNEHASNPTKYTNDVHAIFELLPEKIKRGIDNAEKLHKAATPLGDKEIGEEKQATKMQAKQGKLAYLEHRLAQLHSQREKLLNQTEQGLPTNQLGLLNTVHRQQADHVEADKAQEKELQNRLQILTLIERNKVELRGLLADYNIFQKLIEAIHAKKTPDDLESIIRQLNPGMLKNLLTNKRELKIATGKLSNAMSEVLFDGIPPDQVHPQTEEQAARYHDALLQKIKPLAPEGGQLPDLKGMRPFLTYYQSKDLNFFDKADEKINDVGKTTASWILAAPHLIEGMRVDRQIKSALKDI